MLIEALAAFVLLGVLFALFSSLASMVSKRNTTLTQQTYLAQEARPALDAMADEIQAASCNGATQPFVLANASAFRFTAPNHAQPFHMRQITYQILGNSLYRQVQTSPTAALPVDFSLIPTLTSLAVENLVGTAVFHYYDSDGNEVFPAGGQQFLLQQIARVTATVTVAPPAGGGNTGTLTSQMSAALRTPWSADCT
jgi:type II secretory pathway pseudopilin PulG